MALNQDLALSPNQDSCFNQDLTSNQINNISTCLYKAKEFLQKNPKEQKITAARIFNLPESILRSSISRQSMRYGRDGQNKIRQEHEKEALYAFIQSLLACQIQPTFQLVFNAICKLKHAQNSNLKAPSLRWFHG